MSGSGLAAFAWPPAPPYRHILSLAAPFLSVAAAGVCLSVGAYEPVDLPHEQPRGRRTRRPAVGSQP